MAIEVKPKVFLIGESTVNTEGLKEFLTHIGAPEWESDANSDPELITEVYGRMCYKSFGTDLNPNVTRVRRTNEGYISNIIEKGDGSVLEHGVANFFFCDVSRVFTHELVRHRVGTAMSQESLRYVRLTDLKGYMPVSIQENDQAMTIFAKTFEELSNLQKELAELYDLDNENSFDVKKQVTSAMRRLAPIGLATNIGWSTNFRNLRHVIEMRTAPWAEEEIRLVFAEVAEIAINKWGNLFADYKMEMVDGIPYYTTNNPKI